MQLRWDCRQVPCAACCRGPWLPTTPAAPSPRDSHQPCGSTEHRDDCRARPSFPRSSWSRAPRHLQALQHTMPSANFLLFSVLFHSRFWADTTSSIFFRNLPDILHTALITHSDYPCLSNVHPQTCFLTFFLLLANSREHPSNALFHSDIAVCQFIAKIQPIQTSHMWLLLLSSSSSSKMNFI